MRGRGRDKGESKSEKTRLWDAVALERERENRDPQRGCSKVRGERRAEKGVFNEDEQTTTQTRKQRRPFKRTSEAPRVLKL